MAVHEAVLTEACSLADTDWLFRLDDVVKHLPHLNESTVRTHVASRCCVNAPSNHQHRWPYFRRVGRGRYRIEPKFRLRPTPPSAEAVPATTLRSAIHAVVTGSAGAYTAECLEVAVVTQGRSLDETLRHLREAISLHLDGEDLTALGLTQRPRLVVTHESPLSVVA